MAKKKKISHPVRDLIIICVFFVLAFLLRLANIKVGLYAANYPDFHYFSDELGHIQQALRIGEGSLAVNYVTPLFFYVLFLFDGLFFLLLKIAGAISSLTDFKEIYFCHTDKFLLATRLFISFLGSLTVGLIYFVGKKAFSKKVGLMSAVFLLLSFGHFVKSTEVRPDILLSLFFVLSFLALCLIIKNPERVKYFLWAGTAVGLAASTKPNGLSLLFPFLVLFILLLFQNKQKRVERAKGIAFFLAAAAVTFCLFNLTGFISGAFKDISGAASSSFGSLCYQTPFKHSLPFYITTILPRMLSWPILLAFFLSTLIIPIIRKDNWIEAALLLVTIYSYLLPMGWYTRATWRDMMPILPPIYCAVSYFLVNFLPGKRTVIQVSAVIFLLIIPVKNIYSHIKLLHNPDTRELSKTWIEKNIPSGTHIVIQNYGSPLRRNKEALLRQWNKDDDMLKFSLKNFDENAASYDLYILSKLLDPATNAVDYSFEKNLVHYLKENKISYLILSSRSYSRWFAPAADVHVDKELTSFVREYYQIIENKLNLIKEFVPDKKTTPGPVIKIYKVPEDIENYYSKKIFNPYLRDGAGTVGFYWQ